MEETQKLVAALVGQKNEGPRKGGASDMEDRGSEGSSKSKGKSPEQNEEGRAGGPGFGSGGWVLADSGTPMFGDWHGGRRLEMPIFNGENLDDWIFRVERYFSINRLTEEEKIVAVGVSVNGDALSWF